MSTIRSSTTALNVNRYVTFKEHLNRIRRERSHDEDGDLQQIATTGGGSSVMEARVMHELKRREGPYYTAIISETRKALGIPRFMVHCSEGRNKSVIVVPFVPQEAVAERVKRMFDDYIVAFRNWETSPVEAFDSLKCAMMQHARELMNVKWQSCVEVAGEYDILVMKARGEDVNVHCCYDLTEVNHAATLARVKARIDHRKRFDTATFGEYRGVDEPVLGRDICGNPHKCEVPTEVLVIDHTSVSYSIKDVAELMFRHKAASVVGIVLFTPEMVHKDKGQFPYIGVTFEVDREKDELIFRFTNARERTRVYSYSAYMSLIAQTVCVTDAGIAYVERVESSRGCFYVYKMTGIDELGLKSVRIPKHRVWFENSAKNYILRLMKPKFFGVDTREAINYEWKEIIVSKKFYDQVHSYAMALPAKDFKLSAIREHVVQKSGRVIIQIKDVSVAYDFSIQTQEDIALYVFMTAYIERYNVSMVVSRLIAQTGEVRVMGRSSLLSICCMLLWRMFSTKCKEVFSSAEDWSIDSVFDMTTWNPADNEFWQELLRYELRWLKKNMDQYTRVYNRSVRFEKSVPPMFEEYCDFLENSVGDMNDYTPVRDVKAECGFKPFSQRPEMSGNAGLARALDVLYKKLDKKPTDGDLCEECKAASFIGRMSCAGIPCGCVCERSGHKLALSIHLEAPSVSDSSGDEVVPGDLCGTVGVLSDSDESSLDMTTVITSSSGEVADDEIGYDEISALGECVKDGTSYVYDPAHWFSSTSEAARALNLVGEVYVLRSVNQKAKALRNRSRVYVPVSSDVAIGDEEIVYFSCPRDIRVYCKRFERHALSEAAQALKERLQAIRDVTPEKAEFVRMERAYMDSIDRLPPVSIPKAAAPVMVLQEEYDTVFPGVSTIDYTHDQYWANQGDVDIDFQVPKMELDMTKWYAPRIVGSKSKLRTAQGGLNPQTPVALLGSAMQRNFEVEYQSTPQDIRNAASEVINKTLALFGVVNAVEMLERYQQEEALDVIPDDAYDEYLSKQSSDVIERLANCELGDMFIKYHMHCLMNKDTTKPKLDGSIQYTTPVVQTIVYNDKAANATISPLAEMLTDRFLSIMRPEIAIFFKKNRAELEKHIRANIPFGSVPVTWLDCDGAKFDKSQQEFALLVEMLWYKMLGAKGFDFEKWFDSTNEKSMLSYRAKMRMKLARQRSSGNRNTALGNSVVMISAVASRLAVRREQILCAINLGDDIVIAIHGPIDTRGFDDAVGGVFNISVKCTISTQGYILGHYILQRGDEVKLVYDICRKLESMGREDKMREDKLYETFISFKENVSTLDDATWLPLLQAAIQIRCPHMSGIRIARVASAMKTLASDFDEYKSLYEEYKERYF